MHWFALVPPAWLALVVALVALIAALIAGDGHLAGFCDPALVFHLLIFKVSAWKITMGAMAKRSEQCDESHGKKVHMAKRCLGKMPWHPWHFCPHTCQGIPLGSGPRPRALAPGLPGHIRGIFQGTFLPWAPFCHGSQGIVHAFLPWLPWYVSMPRASK